MSMFEYTLKLPNTHEHADYYAFSCISLPLISFHWNQQCPSFPQSLSYLHSSRHLTNSPVTADQIREHTMKHPQLTPVVQFHSRMSGGQTSQRTLRTTFDTVQSASCSSSCCFTPYSYMHPCSRPTRPCMAS